MFTLTDEPKIVGVVGGGQLCRMMCEAVSPLGLEIICLDPTPDAPARAVCRDQIVGAFDDPEALSELIERSDWLTYDIELAAPEVIREINTQIPVHPRPETLHMIEDKLRQKTRLQEAGIPVPAFTDVEKAEDVRKAADDFGYPLMIKSRTGGYDGRGNLPVHSAEEISSVLNQLPGQLMAESFVPYERELSVMGVKQKNGTATYPPTETVHEEQILRHTITPARTSETMKARAEDLATSVLEVMEGRGVYGIEMFEADGDLYINEIAPRPHNSGHWTIEGAQTSQFEQHLRAVTGLPMGSTEPHQASVTVNILGSQGERPVHLDGVDELLKRPGVHLHWYGKKQERRLRKMGHFTVTGEDPDNTLEHAMELKQHLTFKP